MRKPSRRERYDFSAARQSPFCGRAVSSVGRARENREMRRYLFADFRGQLQGSGRSSPRPDDRQHAGFQQGKIPLSVQD